MNKGRQGLVILSGNPAQKAKYVKGRKIFIALMTSTNNSMKIIIMNIEALANEVLRRIWFKILKICLINWPTYCF